MDKILYLAVLTANLFWIRFVVCAHISKGNPCWYFGLSNWIMGIGSLVLLDFSSGTDRLYAQILLASALLHSLSSLLVLRSRPGVVALSRRFWTIPVKAPSVSVLGRGRLLMIVAAVISVTYFALVGYNALLVGLVGMLKSEEVDVQTLRLESYAGTRYFAPGYVNQFKNVIFPMTTVLMLWVRRERDQAIGLSWVLIPVAIVFLAGAGQRGALVTAALMALMFLALVRMRGKVRSRIGWAEVRLTIGAVGVFSFISALQGRSSSHGSVVVSLATSLWDRLFHSNQYSGVEGFKVVSEMPISNGREWLQAGMGLLPGNRGSSLSSTVFARLYGGSRGTSPVSLWGSLWHNGGWPGVCIGAVLLGVAHGSIYRRMIRGDRETVRLLSYSIVIVLLATWVAGPFTYLLNAGLPAAILLRRALRDRGGTGSGPTGSKPDLRYMDRIAVVSY